MGQGEPRSSSSPVPVGAVLPGVLPGLRERLVEARIRRDWERLMGSELAARAEPVALMHGILQVSVANSSWLQELTLREPDLRRRVAERYGTDVIRALRFSLGKLTAAEAVDVKRRRPAPGRRGRDLLAGRSGGGHESEASP